MSGFHSGRAWTGTAMENNCPCPKAACGLVDLDNTSPDCTQHNVEQAKTMRQGHRVEDCQQFMLTETLRRHRFIAAEARCICGWKGSYGPGTAHAVHLADVLTGLGYIRADHIEYAVDHANAGMDLLDEDDDKPFTDLSDVMAQYADFHNARILQRKVSAWEPVKTDG